MSDPYYSELRREADRMEAARRWCGIPVGSDLSDELAPMSTDGKMAA